MPEYVGFIEEEVQGEEVENGVNGVCLRRWIC